MRSPNAASLSSPIGLSRWAIAVLMLAMYTLGIFFAVVVAMFAVREFREAHVARASDRKTARLCLSEGQRFAVAVGGLHLGGPQRTLVLSFCL